MDFKINLPTEKCKCEAKQFYDKYRKQVDALIKNEQKKAKATKHVVVGKKAPKRPKSLIPKVRSKKKVVLPKIKGAKLKQNIESILGSTTTTETSIDSNESSDEFRSSSLEMKQLIDGDKQKQKSLQEEIVALQLKKKEKAIDFISVLKSKAKKEGLGDDFVANMLSKAKDAGQKENLLFALSNAYDEGTLNTLMFNMLESLNKGEFEAFSTNLVIEGKIERRNALILELINIFKSNQDFNYMADLIKKAREEDPDDELFLILFKAVEENNLNNLISNIYNSHKNGKLDDMISVLMKKGKREQTNQLIAAMNAIALENGKDNSFIEDILLKAKNLGETDELLSILNKAMANGLLDKVISALSNETDISNINSSLKSLLEAEEANQEKKYFTELLLKEGFDDDFIAKLLSKAKTKEEESLIIAKFSQMLKSDKRADFCALIQESSIENIDDLFALSEELLSDDDSNTDVTVHIKSKQKVLRRGSKIKPKHKDIKEYIKQRKDNIELNEEQDLSLEKELSLSSLEAEKNRNIKKKKSQLLYRRQFSMEKLPDIHYDLIKRHKLTLVNIIKSDDEISDEEDYVYTKEDKKKKSKTYRASFLKKIYGSRSKRSTARSISSTSSDRSYTSTTQTSLNLPKKKVSRITIEENEPHLTTPRKIKKHVIHYVQKKSHIEIEPSDSDVSLIEELLDKKIKKLCSLSGEELSDQGYLVGFRYTDDDFDSKKIPKKKSICSDSILSDGSSRARRRAMLYFETRNIAEIFHFLGSHLISHKPDDPIAHLIMLLENCIHFRNGIGKPPLLFEKDHVESLYKSMDIFNDGFISLKQYQIGLETLFIKEFKDMPPTNENKMILKETFIYMALKKQRVQLRNMLRGSSAIFISKENSNSTSTLGSIWSKFELYQDG